MKHKFNIPGKINIGFQERADTYTGKLAFVVYTDDKGTLRKERSWNGWRDQKIAPEEYENVPTDGFVLNKKTGDYRGHFGGRQAWLRIYDPRGFEFEIDVDNLVLILEECSSIKGKGLEGEFVYAWDKAKLLLLPVSSQEYKNSVEFKTATKEKVKKADIKEGFCFVTKDNEKVMYLGRMPYWSWHFNTFKSENKHIFARLNESKDKYLVAKNFTKILSKAGNEASPAFADMYEEYVESEFGSGPTKLATRDAKASYISSWYDLTFIKQGGKYHAVCKRDTGYGKARKTWLEMSKDFVIVESGKAVKVPIMYYTDSANFVKLPDPIDQYRVVSLFVVNEYKKKIKIGH